AADQVVDYHRGAAGTERDVVLSRSLLIGMAFDEDAVVAVAVEPGRLLVERCLRLRRQRRGIDREEHAVADGDEELLLAARCPTARTHIADAGTGAATRTRREGNNEDDQRDAAKEAD